MFSSFTAVVDYMENEESSGGDTFSQSSHLRKESKTGRRFREKAYWKRPNGFTKTLSKPEKVNKILNYIGLLPKFHYPLYICDSINITTNCVNLSHPFYGFVKRFGITYNPDKAEWRNRYTLGRDSNSTSHKKRLSTFCTVIVGSSPTSAA